MIPSDASPEDPTRVDRRAGQTLGKYRLLRHLGAGGMGVVFEAEDADLRRTVAVKVLVPPPGLTSSGDALTLRFLRERSAARVSHPNVVPIYDVNREQTPAYFVMEYQPGGSVAQLAQAIGRVPWVRATGLIVQAGRGLAAAHAAGLIHRDVKPGNLLIAADGTVKVADFGLVKVVDLSVGKAVGDVALSGPSQLLGTPHFMSPEQCQGEALDERTDVYSLAVTLYLLLTGRLPFDADNVYGILYAVCSGPPPDPRRFAPDVPAALVDVVNRGMARVRGSRYATMKAFVAELERVLAPAAMPPAPHVPRPSRRRWLIAGTAVAVPFATGALWLAFGRRRAPEPAGVDPGAVLAKLRQANPQWRGEFTPSLDDKRIVGLTLTGDGLTNLEPLTELIDLDELTYDGLYWGKGKLNDVAPLAKLPNLKRLTIQHCALNNVGPLSQLKLEKLDLMATRVASLKPLRRMPLRSLNLHGTLAVDLAPLSLCPLLEDLYVPNVAVTLEPLRGLTALRKVQMYGCEYVTSLSPLSGSPVEYLDCRGVGIGSLDELAGWTHLRELHCDKRFEGKIPRLPKLDRVELDPTFSGEEEAMSAANPPTILEQISTRWPQVSDPGKFVLRYAPAIQRYLLALLRDAHAVDEVTQELLLRVVQQRFVPEQVTRGRFRDYLKAVVRNAAFSHLRKEQARPPRGGDVELLADDSEDPTCAAEREWVAKWRQCLLERVWDDLDAHQRENPSGRCFSVMRLTVDHPDADSPALAQLLSEQDGEPIKAEAFRKQLSRARRLFARYLMRQIAATLEKPSAESIEEELGDLGLLDDVLPLLPDDWRERGDLLDL